MSNIGTIKQPEFTKASENDKRLKVSFGDFNQEAKISNDTSVNFGDSQGSIKITTPNGYLKTRIDFSNLGCTCSNVLSNPVVDTKTNTVIQSCQCGAASVEVQPKDLYAKENIILNNRPIGDYVAIVIEDTNLIPELKYVKQEPVGKINKLEDLSTCGWTDLGYDQLIWKTSGGDYALSWDNLIAIGKNAQDEIIEVSRVLVRQILDIGGKPAYGLVLDSESLDRVFANQGAYLVIDPTTTVITSDSLLAVYAANRAVYNGADYLFATQTSGGGAYVQSSSDPTSSWSDESGTCTMLAADLYYTEVVHLASGKMLLIGCSNSANGYGYSARRELNGTWNSRVEIYNQYFVGVRGMQADVDENGNIFLIYNINNYFLFMYSDDEGDTWNFLTAPASPVNWSGSLFNIVCPGDGTVIAFYIKLVGGGGYLHRDIYTIATDTWSGPVQVNSTYTIQITGKRLHVLMDADGDFHIMFPTNADQYFYINNKSGTYDTIGQITTSGNQYPSMQLDSIGNVIFFIRATAAASQIKIYNGSTLTFEDPNWFGNSSVLYAFQGHKRADLDKGEPYWAIATGSGGVYFCQNTDYNFPGGNGGFVNHRALESNLMSANSFTALQSNNFVA